MEYYTPFQKELSNKPFGEISRLENDYFVDGKLVEWSSAKRPAVQE